MFGSRVEYGKQRQIMFRIGKDIHIIAEVELVAGRIPANVAIGLRESSGAIAVEDSLGRAVAGMVRTDASGSNHWGTVTGHSETGRMDDAAANGFIEKASTKYTEQSTVSFVIKPHGRRRQALNQIGNRFLFN